MAIAYKIVTIPNFADDLATEALLDAEGLTDWDLVQTVFATQQDGTTTATCIFKK